MSRRSTDKTRRRLALRRETLLRLSNRDLAGIGGGTDDTGSWGCVPDTTACDTTECWMSTNSRFC